MKKVFIIFLLFPILLSAQNKKFKIGFDLNWEYLVTLKNNNSTYIWPENIYPLPLSLNLSLTYNLSKKFSLQTKMGHTMPFAMEQYFGFQYGVNGIYNFNKNLYISAGVMHHSNSSCECGHTSGRNQANLLFISGGLGYYIKNNIAIEINYFHSTKSKPIFYIGNQGLNDFHSFFLESMIRVSLVFGWDLKY